MSRMYYMCNIWQCMYISHGDFGCETLFGVATLMVYVPMLDLDHETANNSRKFEESSV